MSRSGRLHDAVEEILFGYERADGTWVDGPWSDAPEDVRAVAVGAIVHVATRILTEPSADASRTAPPPEERKPEKVCVHCGHLRDVHGAQRVPSPKGNEGWRCNQAPTGRETWTHCPCPGFEPSPCPDCGMVGGPGRPTGVSGLSGCPTCGWCI